MEITNRAIALLVLLILALVGGAGALNWLLNSRSGQVIVHEVEVQHLDLMPEVIRRGAKPLEGQGPVQVRPAKGYAPQNIGLTCDSHRSERPFLAGVATFESVPLGQCSLTFSPQDDPFGPVLPGDRLVCESRDFSTLCTGSIADKHPGTLHITSEIPGVLFIDGEKIGLTPQRNLRRRMGTHELRVETDQNVVLHWPLVIAADEQIEVHFPSPTQPK